MSADNGIYVLKTKAKIKGYGVLEVYRVACVWAIDNFDYYQNKSDKEFDDYIKENWLGAYTLSVEHVLLTAYEMQREYNTEYGIQVIEPNDKNYIHPNDRNL